MGILSSSVSLTRYGVKGEIGKPILETIADGLKKNVVAEIDGDVSEKAVGWTSFENPFNPYFEGNSFVFGEYLIFSLRIDRKSIPSKVIKKHYAAEAANRLAESGREHLSRNEKQMIRENVVRQLSLRIPATPDVYDFLWNCEDAFAWFFSNQKAANDELETLFSKSFNLTLVRLFPYTIAESIPGFSDAERETLSGLFPTKFAE